MPETHSPAAPPGASEKAKPFIIPEYCKGCGRCIGACPKHCIDYGNDINPRTGLTPVVIDLSVCNGCGLCISACPEPFGLRPQGEDSSFELEDPSSLFGPRATTAPQPVEIPDEEIELPAMEPMVLKGTYASAIGALLAGCRHFFGYPITPSTEGAELMAKLLPKLGGIFLQAVSEVAAINMIYGCGAAGKRAMSFTSGPGFSLMLEGFSYMIGAEVPGVVVDIMRAGPGLGNIGPGQADIKLACHGLGHGNTHALVFAPATPQEMLDITMLAFDLSFKYRNPVIILGDGYLGQITGKVLLPRTMRKPGIPDWAVWGDRMHRRNLVCSIQLSEADMEILNRKLIAKYSRMQSEEQRAELFRCDDAEIILVACNTPSQMCKGAVRTLRNQGIKAGLLRPISLWPFPIDFLLPVARRCRRIIVVEASYGQLENELRLALSKATREQIPEIENIRHFGGILPHLPEIVAYVASGEVVKQ